MVNLEKLFSKVEGGGDLFMCLTRREINLRNDTPKTTWMRKRTSIRWSTMEPTEKEDQHYRWSGLSQIRRRNNTSC